MRWIEEIDMTLNTLKLPKPKVDDIAYAYECAADFLEAEEWPEDDGGATIAAYREVAKRLRRAGLRVTKTALNNRKTGERDV